MGRYIHISNGTNVTVYPIIGNDGDNSANKANGDVWLIKARHPKSIESQISLAESSLSIPWDAEVVEPGNDNQANYVIIIIMSPETGAVHTYVQQQPTADFMPATEDVVGVGANNDTNLCLNPNSGLVSYRLGVVIRADASSQSSVQLLSDEGGPC